MKLIEKKNAFFVVVYTVVLIESSAQNNLIRTIFCQSQENKNILKEFFAENFSCRKMIFFFCFYSSGYYVTAKTFIFAHVNLLSIPQHPTLSQPNMFWTFFFTFL